MTEIVCTPGTRQLEERRLVNAESMVLGEVRGARQDGLLSTSLRDLGAIALAALVLRVVWLLAQHPSEITWDGAEYARMATSLRQGLGFIGIRGTLSMVFPPLYPVAIAAAMFLTPKAEIAGTIVSVLAGVTLIVPVYASAELLGGRRAAVFAGIVAAFLPFAVDISVLVLADALFMTLAAFGIYFAMRFAKFVRLEDALWSGTAFGLSYLTRPEGLVLGAGVLTALAIGIAFLPRHRWRRARGVAAAAALMAVIASPYAAFLSTVAGHFRLEGKSAINFTIARRMQSGLSYTVAADAIDERLREVGPELHSDYYFVAPPGERASSWAILELATADAKRHTVEIVRTLISRSFGTPLLALAILFGFLRGRWTRERLALELVPIAYGTALFLALASVYHFWDRYADGFIVLLAVWGGRGIDEACTAFAPGKFYLQRAVIAATAALFLAILFGMRETFREGTNDTRSVVDREVGELLERADPTPGSIMSVSDQSVYYAGGTWVMLPWAPDAGTALAYVKLKNPQYIVLNRDLASERPYLVTWLDHGIPDQRAKLLQTVGDARRPAAQIYRWFP
jgi:4-amino-4-deoxy-L-arabinose transferase-like glycosyltransferase